MIGITLNQSVDAPLRSLTFMANERYGCSLPKGSIQTVENFTAAPDS